MGFETIIPAAASLIGASMQSDATGDAAASQAASTQAAIDENRRQFDLTRQDYAPYRETGVNALQRLWGEIDRQPTAQDVMSQPGYQFGMDEGLRALDRRFAAQGGRVSGASMKAATRFGTDYGTSGYSAAYQRSQDRLNRLAALAGIGQSATGASAQAGDATAGRISSAIQSQGDATGAAQLARGNIWGNTANSIAALYARNANRGGAQINTQFGLPQYAIDPYGSP